MQDCKTDSDNRVVPTPDYEQNWILANGRQADGFTTLEFSRLLDTGDAIGDIVIEKVQVRPKACFLYKQLMLSS